MMEKEFKALILAGGRGKRLKDLTENRNKCMLEFEGKHLIEYSLDLAVNTVAKEIVCLVGYKAEDIINYYGINYKGVKIRYVIQDESRGLVHAIECCREAIDGSDFMLLLGDEIFIMPKHSEMIDNFSNNKEIFTICGVLRVEVKELIKNTYSILFDETERVLRLVEKPNKPLNNIMGTGNCIFRNRIFDYIKKTPINAGRGEKELPDLIQCAIDDGNLVKYFFIAKNYVNVNTENDVIKIRSL